ncbi:MAG: hypothetical protein QG641_1719 [Candidatus Poribacteria bacterium]|nr:hypothetical protein [Candidatus Poribacteria bacterium]
MEQRKKISAIVTAYYPSSHADVIITKFLKGFPTDNGLLPPKVDIASIYIDQTHDRDIGIKMADQYGVSVYPSIRQALTLGGKELAVDGVILIGEHGDYAWNEKDQQLYPRRYFLEQTCGVFATSGRSVPVYSDKHLSYNWSDAKWMYERTKELEVPFMAGSSLPLGWRNPWLEYPLNTKVEEAITVAYGGLESYGFHALELLQCMVERRFGGETGIRSVQCIEGNDVWKAGNEGRWSQELAKSALACIEGKKDGNMEMQCEAPAVFLLEYSDGLCAGVLMLNNYLQGWGYSGRVNGQVQSMETYLPNSPYAHFSYLSLNIQQLFLTGTPPYPVERTLLVSGALDALMESRYKGHIRIETPYLDVHYRSYNEMLIRPLASRPKGASLVPFDEEVRYV